MNFQGLSVARNCLRPETSSLTILAINRGLLCNLAKHFKGCYFMGRSGTDFQLLLILNLQNVLQQSFEKYVKYETCKGICSYYLVYNFLIQFLSLKSLVFVVHFLNAFWHRNKAFPKGSSQNEIVPLLVVFHLPHRKYKGVKICFYSCRYQNQFFSLVPHSCCTRVCWTRSLQSCNKQLYLCNIYLCKKRLNHIMLFFIFPSLFGEIQQSHAKVWIIKKRMY